MFIGPWLISHLLSTGLVVVVVSILGRLLRHRPALVHVLWVVVLVKLLIPPVVSWHLPAVVWQRFLSPASSAAAPIESVEIARGDAPAIDREQVASQSLSPISLPALGESTAETVGPGSAAPSASLVESEVRSVPRPPDGVDSARQPAPRPQSNHASVGAPTAPRFTESPPIEWRLLANRAVMCVWLLGSLIASTVEAWRIVRHQRLVRRAGPAPAYFAEQVVKLSTALRIRPIAAHTSAEISSPFVWCLGRPVLIWPACLLGAEQLHCRQGVIAHELAHIRRRDQWVAWLELLARVAWWWNPLCWIVRRQLHESAELACDALVIELLPGQRRAYAEAFLELSTPRDARDPLPALGVRSADRASFERRLTMIMSDNVPGRLTLSGLVCAFVLAGLALPGWTLGQTTVEATPPAPSAASPAAATTPAPTSNEAPAKAEASPIERKAQRLARLCLGLELEAFSPDEAGKGDFGQFRGGLKISGVVSDTSAEAEGLRVGDLLVGIDRYETVTLDNVVFVLEKLAKQQPGPEIAALRAELEKLGKPSSAIEKLLQEIQAPRVRVYVRRNGTTNSVTLALQSAAPTEDDAAADLPALKAPASLLSTMGYPTAVEEELPKKSAQTSPNLKTETPERQSAFDALSKSADLSDEAKKLLRQMKSELEALASQRDSLREQVKMTTGEAAVLAGQLRALTEQVARHPELLGTRGAVRDAATEKGTLVGGTDRFSIVADQTDVTSLGLAIIEAEGAFKQAKFRMTNLYAATREKGASIGKAELQTAEIDAHTAGQKLEFLMTIARAACDGTSREVDVQRAKVRAIQKLIDDKVVSKNEIGDDQLRLELLEGKLKVFERMGVRPSQDKSSTEDDPDPAPVGTTAE